MKMTVMSRKAAHEYSFQNIPKTIIISIASIDEEKNTFAKNPNIIDILYLFFDDVEKNEPNHITITDARLIIDFINKYKNSDVELVVHCGAGVSRSAGVCAAIMKIVNDNDFPIFDNPRFCPNMTCYRTVLETYFGAYDEEAAAINEQHNINVWLKAIDNDENE